MVAISKLINNGLLLAGQQIFSNVASPQQASAEQYNVVRFLAGAGPYIQHPGFGISTDVPDQCTLEQVHLLSRHGERFPSTGSGEDFEAIMAKFDDYNETFAGPLAFLNDYTYFVSSSDLYEKETSPINSQSIYAGTLNAQRHGMSFRSKYQSLFNASEEALNVFASNSGRVHQTAKYFARGFLGDEYSDETVAYYILDEDEKMGANSLTPRSACTAFDQDAQTDVIAQLNSSWLDVARDRLLEENESLDLTSDDVENLFKWCAYEINVRGSSPFCDLFTNEEFVKYSYSQDVDNYYSNSFGNNVSASIAAPYLNATLKFLLEEDPAYKVLLAFSHDTDIEVFHAGLGLVQPAEDLPTDHIPFPSPYNHGRILPQGARLVTEKYACDGQSYVRYILNDAVFPITSCQSGPGFSCELSEFQNYINGRLEGKDYATQCAVNSTYPTEVSFLWDYATVNYTAEDINS